jgi:serine protease Do
MTPDVTSAPKGRKVLSARRLVLLASVAGLGATVFFAGAQFAPPPSQWTNAATAQELTTQNLARPTGFADIVERVKPAVIGVRVKVDGGVAQMNERDAPIPPSLERFFRQFGMPMPEGRGPRNRNFSMSQGSGFFISADGYAVTNNHVVSRGKTIEVQTDDNKTYQAKVVGTDPKTDLALLKIDGRTDFPYVKLSKKTPRIGDWVLAVGNPFGLGGTVTAGIVSARGRDIGNGPYDDFLQIDAPINRGNSGGPTFDLDGNVIGVNTAIFSPSGGSIGIGFAVPATTVENVVEQLREHGTVSRGWIGVQIQPVTADIADSLGLKKAEGALVAEPQPNGPAAKAGVVSGDVITSVNGEPVKDARDLAKKIGATTPGSTVKLGVVRKGEEKTFALTLADFPKEQQQARAGGEPEQSGDNTPALGLTLAPASSVAGSSGDGVVVVNVDPDGPAAERGFKAGDVILDVGGKKVSNPDDVRKVLADARTQGKRTVLMRVKSGESTRFVALPLGRA